MCLILDRRFSVLGLLLVVGVGGVVTVPKRAVGVILIWTDPVEMFWGACIWLLFVSAHGELV